MFEIGQILENKYKIVELIGTGGGGIVYKANQLGLDRFVVIKLIKENVAGVISDKGEANVLKNLKNNFIPSVYDFISKDGQIYTVMEFIDGKSFQQLLDNGKKFPQSKILKYARQLCEAVVYLHSRKIPIIHSDIKPANIMLTSEDNICLIDYNISLIVDGNEKAIGVSDGYSPPEQYGQAYYNGTETNRATKIETSATATLIDENRCGQIYNSEAATLIDSNTVEEKFVSNSFSSNATLIDKQGSLINDPDKTVYDGGITKTLIKSNDGIQTATLVDKNNFQNRESTPQFNAFNKRKIDKRSDIYAIGATLYHMVSGKKPAISTEYVIPLSKLNIRISESFAAIIDKAMQKDPSKRFDSAGKMLKALNNLKRYDRRYKNLIFKQEIAAFIVIAGMAVACLTSVIGYSRIGEEITDKYNGYVSEIDSLDIKEAEQVYDEAIKIFPDRAEAYEKMAFIIYNTEDYNKTAEYISEVVNGPQLYTGENRELYSFDKLNYTLGRCYLELGKYKLSVNALENAVSENGDENSYYCDYAVALARCDEIEKAEDVLQAAIKKGLSDADVYFARGEIEFARGNYSDSISNIEMSISSDIDEDILYRAYLTGANAYEELYHSDQSIGTERIDFLNSAISRLQMEKTMPFYEMLAQAYIDEASQKNDIKYYSDAINTYEKMNVLGWETENSTQMLIRLYRITGNYNYAQKYANEMLEKNSDDYVVYKLLAFIESDIQNNRDRSERDYSNFVSYYKKAKNLCDDASDSEMQLLDEAYEKLVEENMIGG